MHTLLVDINFIEGLAAVSFLTFLANSLGMSTISLVPGIQAVEHDISKNTIPSLYLWLLGH